MDALKKAKVTDEDFDRLEVAMLEGLPLVPMEVEHRYTPGLYAREIHMKAGELITSKVHKVEHPYVVLTGSVSVYDQGTGTIEHLVAPHVGITKPGTRRLLFIREDCRWITFHPNPENKSVEDLEDDLIERRDLPDGRNVHELYKGLVEQLPGQDELGGAP